jgi:4-amino-4-deoxy-L-arabinose transferase-like glycosyltransferase
LTISQKRCFFGLWLLFVASFALLHALHLSADFPNHTLWFMDWAKYTDEGWYGNAAIRAHLFGNWYLVGDFNPAPALPLWPFLEWVLFFFTGVSVEAARGLAVGFFCCNLLLSYLLLRAKAPRWVAMLAVTLIVTSPFVYCFSRLAILEPMLTTLTLVALNLAIRLARMRRPLAVSAAIGLLFTLMMLTKTTAVFLLPALGWAMLVPLWGKRKLALSSAAAAGSAFAATYGLWMALVVHFGLLADYKYLFFVNKYDKPKEFYWPLLSFWWSFHGVLWVGRILLPLAGLVTLVVIAGAALALLRQDSAMARRNPKVRALLVDPVFGASILAVGSYIFFMTYQNHPQPRYFAVVAFFSFYLVALGAGALLSTATPAGEGGRRHSPEQIFGWTVVALASLTAAFNGFQTLNYALHPEYTFVNAAQRLTQYIDAHPNGNRLLVSISGDQITMVSHLPTLCDDFSTPSAAYPDLVTKLARYQPGWWATWNDIDPGTLEDLHVHFSLEQVASFRAFDDPERNELVLFKLHALPGGKTRSPGDENLQLPLPGDKIEIPIE